MINVLEVNENSGAHEAGMKTGDLITHVDDESIKGISSNEDVRKHLLGIAGTPVKLGILRDGKAINLTVIRKKLGSKFAQLKLSFEDFRI